jgi:hypothetical protein
MVMKPTATQAVRLLSSAAAVPAGRARAPRGPLRSQFLARLAPETGPQIPARPDGDDTPAQPDVLPATAAAPPAAPALPEPALSRRIARACARDERTSLRMARLAAVIGDFVNTPAVIDSGCWELQIALDPALLPATRLRLSLSSWRLSLRFESNDRDARCVILDNSRELQHRLQALLPAHIDIDIVCW